MANQYQITRQHLQGFGLTPYQAVTISKGCPIQGRSGSANLYTAFDILTSAEQYLQKPRIRDSTRSALFFLIRELTSLVSHVIAMPFGREDSDVMQAVKPLIIAKTETNRFKLRSAALKGKKLRA